MLYKSFLSAAVLVCLAWGHNARVSAAIWTDDFSDGDDTSNPTWIHYSDGGVNPSWSVIDDGTGNNIYVMSIEGGGSGIPRMGAWVQKKCPTIGHPGLLDREREYRSQGKSWWDVFLLTKLDWLDSLPGLGYGYALVSETMTTGSAPDMSVRLSRFDGVVNETVLASTIMPFTEDWFNTSIHNDQGHLTANWWLGSGPEPTTPLFDVFDYTYSSFDLYYGVEIRSSNLTAGNSVAMAFDDFVGTPEPGTLSLLLGVSALTLLRRPGRSRRPLGLANKG